jgi:hypothetical protein
MTSNIRAFKKAFLVYETIRHNPKLSWLNYCYVTKGNPMSEYDLVKGQLLTLGMTRILVTRILGISAVTAFIFAIYFNRQEPTNAMILYAILCGTFLLLCTVTMCLYHIHWHCLIEALLELNWKNKSFTDDVLRLNDELCLTGVISSQFLAKLESDEKDLDVPILTIRAIRGRDVAMIRDILTADVGEISPATAEVKRQMKRRFELHQRFSIYLPNENLDRLYKKVKSAAKQSGSLIETDPQTDNIDPS